MQTTSLDRYEPPRTTTASTLSTQSYNRRSSKASYSPTPLFAPGIGTGYREQTHETSISIQLWHSNQLSASTSTLSKAPLLREVPQVKRKLTRKDRDSGVTVSETRSFPSLKSAAPSWLREKPSRQKLAGQLSPAHQNKGVWKKATAICRDHGVLLIYGEDRALVHSISTKDLSATDIRLVDDSLFACPNVLGIFSRPSTFTAGARSPQPSNVRLATGQVGKDEPIYLCFPTNRKMKRWRGLMRTFAKPEIYGTPQHGGAYRCYRQVDMSIIEVKLAGERPILPARSNGVISPTFDDEEDSTEFPTVLGISNRSSEGVKRQSIDEAAGRKNPHNAPDSLPLSSSNTSVDAQESSKGKVSPTDDGDDSDNGVVSGPISGISGRDRILEGSPTVKHGSAYEMERKISEGTGISSTTLTACYCVVWMAGEIVAQTKVRSGPSIGATWLDKFSLKDLPNLGPIQIDVMQSGRNGKFGVLGTVHLPMYTMKRGEEQQGWYPFYTSTSRDSDGMTFPVESSYTDRILGQIKMSITLREEFILPLKKYSKLDEALYTRNGVKLMQTLCKQLDEDHIISHLVDIHASKGTIVELLSKLTDAECSTFGEKSSDLALLFRSNTLLTRAVDKYQRNYCKDWLEACVGPTVRRICHDRIWLEANDSHHYYTNPIQADGSTYNSTTSGIIVGESNLDALLRLCRELWNNIYSNRHRCPRDLRSALSGIRNKVNFQMQHTIQSGPGIQGVGAFVFLRLICPAITTPNIYGLMGSKANEASSKTLMLVAKVFLALANKRSAFDKDKEPWLVKANEFLALQSTAYDDFITYISTEPPKHEIIKESLGDEPDYGFQDLIKGKVDNLPTLHRESIPSSDYMLDHALALASLVSFVLKEASVEMYQDEKSNNSRILLEMNQQQQVNEDYADQYDYLIDVCCEIQDNLGRSIDRAGYNPEPLDIGPAGRKESVSVKSTQIFTALSPPQSLVGAVVASSSTPPMLPSTPSMPSTRMSRSDSAQSNRARRATVSEGRLRSEEEANAIDQQQQKSVIVANGEGYIPNKRIVSRFAPHLETTTSERLSMESEEEEFRRAKRSSGRAAEQLVDFNGNQSPRVVDGGGGGGGGMTDQRTMMRIKSKKQSMEESRVGLVSDTSTFEDQSSIRKTSRGWWKKL